MNIKLLQEEINKEYNHLFTPDKNGEYYYDYPSEKECFDKCLLIIANHLFKSGEIKNKENFLNTCKNLIYKTSKIKKERNIPTFKEKNIPVFKEKHGWGSGEFGPGNNYGDNGWM